MAAQALCHQLFLSELTPASLHYLLLVDALALLQLFEDAKRIPSSELCICRPPPETLFPPTPEQQWVRDPFLYWLMACFH